MIFSSLVVICWDGLMPYINQYLHIGIIIIIFFICNTLCIWNQILKCYIKRPRKGIDILYMLAHSPKCCMPLVLFLWGYESTYPMEHGSISIRSKLERKHFWGKNSLAIDCKCLFEYGQIWILVPAENVHIRPIPCNIFHFLFGLS